ncbi:hypothetical protein [Planctomicrobium sp. SH527]|uniref:hypothetical protein n=1 Tax=Planctomicrobium sp. SH527 TaxID=3448123 RepID=UPI003F5CA5D9
MIALSDVIADLQKYWVEVSPSEIPTLFPGTPLDVNELESWIEFWVTQSYEPPHRSTQRPISIMIDVHCFSKAKNRRTVWKLADDVRLQLSRMLLEIHSQEDQETATGYLRLNEAVCRDLTRDSEPNRTHLLQHVVVSIQGHVDCAEAATSELS